MIAKTLTTAGVRLFVNGGPYARVKSFGWGADTPRKAIQGLDIMEPLELAPTTSRVTCRMQLYRTLGDGGAEGAGLTTPLDSLPRERYFSIQLITRNTDTVIFEARYCSVVRQSWSAPEKGVITGELEIEAIDWSNEVRYR